MNAPIFSPTANTKAAKTKPESGPVVARKLAGKVALVTGSSRGIGAAIARDFAAAGAKVAVTYCSNDQSAKALTAEINQRPDDEALCLHLDVAKRASIRAALDTVSDRWGHMDILVNNAGFLEQKPLSDISEDDWDHTLNTNLKGAFLCTQEAAPLLEHSRAGCVINISSVGGQFGGPKAPHYAASKAGLISFTKSTARLMAPKGIRANAIAPGFIRTEMYDQIMANSDEQSVLAGIPLGRVGEVSDVSAAAIFLASEDSSFITGHVLNVNGGQYMA